LICPRSLLSPASTAAACTSATVQPGRAVDQSGSHDDAAHAVGRGTDSFDDDDDDPFDPTEFIDEDDEF
jgi:hypothetical protein